MAVKEAQAGLDGVLDVTVRFEEKDATVRYLLGEVLLDQILKRYEDTPFDVALAGAVVSIARTKLVTVRGWSERPDPSEQPTVIAADQGNSEVERSRSIDLFVELLPATAVRLAEGTQLSLSDPEAIGLELLDKFQEVELVSDHEDKQSRSDRSRYIARVTEAVTLKPGEITVPVSFRIPSTDADRMPHTADGTIDLVVCTLRARETVNEIATGVALIDGILELRLGHLCDQRGCVEHFHKSLGEIPGLAAVRPHPSLDEPRATVHLRARQPVDIWTLRESLRHSSIEPASIVPRELTSYRLRIELPRWRVEEQSDEAEQCVVCRDRTAQLVEKLSWAKDVEIAGGGINFRPAHPDHDLVELLDAITNDHLAPLAVWLLPAGVPMPKAAPLLLADAPASPKHGGSNVHPVVEFHFGHTCDVGTDILTVLGQRAWSTRTHTEFVGEAMIARAAISERKFANLISVFDELRSAGHVPRKTQLSEFGDVRIDLEFSHICGGLEYSKPPKKKAKEDSKEKMPQDDADNEPTQTKKKPEKKKPFVPKPLRPEKSSNGRQAIEAALARVALIQNAMFHDYHTKPEFVTPRKLTLSLRAKGDDVATIDELIRSLQSAGFPPQSVIVSRRFPGIPFGKELPADLQVTDGQGKRHSLSALQKPGQPLAVAFVSLKCPRHEKYTADAKLFDQLARTIDKYDGRVGFVAVSANSEDRFADVVEFWEKTGLSVPLLHDSDGQAHSVFNSQVTPPPHLFVFDADGFLRYAGEPHDKWEEPNEEKDDFLARALDLIIAGTYQANGAVFYNKSLCNCSDPNCKCPKCGCGATCRCTIKH